MEDGCDPTLTGVVFWPADPKRNGGCNGVYEIMQRLLSVKEMSAMNQVSKQTKETTGPWMKEAKDGPFKAVAADLVQTMTENASLKRENASLKRKRERDRRAYEEGVRAAKASAAEMQRKYDAIQRERDVLAREKADLKKPNLPAQASSGSRAIFVKDVSSTFVSFHGKAVRCRKVVYACSKCPDNTAESNYTAKKPTSYESASKRCAALLSEGGCPCKAKYHVLEL